MNQNFDTQSYRETLDAAALAYLQRHHAKHLGDEQILFGLCVAHLVASLGAGRSMAETTVARAFGELKHGSERRYLNVSASTGSTACITDPDSGRTYCVPVAWICQQLIDHPKRERLRATP